MDQSLSQELIAYANELDQDYESFLTETLSPDEHKKALDAKYLANNLARIIIWSREEIALKELSVMTSWVQEHRDSASEILDSHYTIRQLEDVPSLVRRTLQLSELSARETPSRQTNRYLSEASRAYIHGFQLSSVAMSRAALEQALKEKLGPQAIKERLTLATLIKQAKDRRILPRDRIQAAYDLKVKCDHGMHVGPIETEDAAREVLIDLRSLLQEIYSADATY